MPAQIDARVKPERDEAQFAEPLTRGRKSWGTVVARLTVISEALARTRRRVVLKAARGQPIRSSGHLTYECGNCGAIVLENVELNQIRDCVVECDCGAFSKIAR